MKKRGILCILTIVASLLALCPPVAHAAVNVKYNYDDLNRLTSVIYLAQAKYLLYVYDEVGNITKIVSATATSDIDTDGDSYSDWVELLQGYDPLSANSTPPPASGNCKGTIGEIRGDYYEDKDGDGEGCDPSATNIPCANPVRQCFDAGTVPSTSVTVGNTIYVGSRTDCNDTDATANGAMGNCGYTYYFPSIKDNDGIGWVNNISVQAKDPVPMDVTIHVYDMAGNLAGTSIYSDTKTIAPNARVATRPSFIAGAPIEGSLVVKTSVPAIASTNTAANSWKGFTIYEAAKPRQIHFFVSVELTPSFATFAMVA